MLINYPRVRGHITVDWSNPEHPIVTWAGRLQCISGLYFASFRNPEVAPSMTDHTLSLHGVKFYKLDYVYGDSTMVTPYLPWWVLYKAWVHAAELERWVFDKVLRLRYNPEYCYNIPMAPGFQPGDILEWRDIIPFYWIRQIFRRVVS